MSEYKRNNAEKEFNQKLKDITTDLKRIRGDIHLARVGYSSDIYQQFEEAEDDLGSVMEDIQNLQY